jgi:hypothetical protein
MNGAAGVKPDPGAADLLSQRVPVGHLYLTGARRAP